MAFLIPSIQFFFCLSHALFCFDIHFNAIFLIALFLAGNHPAEGDSEGEKETAMRDNFFGGHGTCFLCV
jgi:hypothetical protein